MKNVIEENEKVRLIRKPRDAVSKVFKVGEIYRVVDIKEINDETMYCLIDYPTIELDWFHRDEIEALDD